MRKADYARKQVACKPARPTEHPSAPAIRVQKDQASDSTSTAATSDTPRKRDAATEPDRPHLRAIDQPQLPLHPPARECGKCSAPCSSSRTILLQPSRPNAMLSRRCATAVVNANWWDSGRLEHLVRPQRGKQTWPAFRRPVILSEDSRVSQEALSSEITKITMSTRMLNVLNYFVIRNENQQRNTVV